MRFISLLILALMAVLLIAMGWQHFRYLDWRRSAAQDHPPLLHSSSAFHVISYLRLEPGVARDAVSVTIDLVGGLEAGEHLRACRLGRPFEGLCRVLPLNDSGVLPESTCEGACTPRLPRSFAQKSNALAC